MVISLITIDSAVEFTLVPCQSSVGKIPILIVQTSTRVCSWLAVVFDVVPQNIGFRRPNFAEPKSETRVT